MAKPNQTILIIALLGFFVIAGVIGYMIWNKKEKYSTCAAPSNENYGGYVSKINPVYVPTPQECTMCPFKCLEGCPNQNFANDQATIGNWFPNKAFVGIPLDRRAQYSDEAHRKCCPNDLSGCPSDESAL